MGLLNFLSISPLHSTSSVMRFILILLATLCCIVIEAHSAENVRFFSPQGVAPAFVPKTHFAMINSMSVEQVKQSQIIAKNTPPFIVNIDFGPVLCDVKSNQLLAKTYISKDCGRHQKALTALSDNKIRTFPSDTEIGKRLAPFLEIMQPYAQNIGTVYLADEPYLNGISKQELERADAKMRSLLKTYKLPKVKIGVIFAGGMFNKILGLRPSHFCLCSDQKSQFLGETHIHTTDTFFLLKTCMSWYRKNENFLTQSN